MNAFWAGAFPWATMAGDADKEDGPRVTKPPMNAASRAERTPTVSTRTTRRVAEPRRSAATIEGEPIKQTFACKSPKFVEKAQSRRDGPEGTSCSDRLSAGLQDPHVVFHRRGRRHVS